MNTCLRKNQIHQIYRLGNLRYITQKNYHLEDKSFETNLNLRNESGEYNLSAELLSDKNNIPFIFVKFQGHNKAYI